jgi:putative ATP-dependent endonuclease of OLD family
MRVTAIRIENFRSIKTLDLDLGDTTVFVGPNNAGKTAILDALRIALTRKWGQRGTGFTEYDVHLAAGERPLTFFPLRVVSDDEDVGACVSTPLLKPFN